jgi:ribose transport system substrate-binding protein
MNRKGKKMFKKLLTILIITALAVTVGLVGISCKTAVVAETTAAVTTAAATTAAAAATTAAAAETTAAAETKDITKYKIGSYWPAVHPYYESVKKGLAKHKEDFGVDVYSQIGTDWTQPTENEQVEALVAQGYNGLMIFPLDAAGANALYEEIVAKGVPIVNFGAATLVPTPASFTVATDVKAAAMIATEKVIATMGGKGGILNVLEVVTDPNTILRKQGVEEVVAKYPDVTIVQTIGDMNAVEQCIEKISSALAAQGDKINGIVTTGYNPTVAVATILSEMKNTKIAFVGIDDDPVVLKAIKEGYVTGTFNQNPYLQGYCAPVLLEYLIDGLKTKEAYAFIDTSGVLITKDNVDGGFMDTLWKAATDLAANAKATYFQ